MLYNIVHSILREVENINAYGLFSFFLFFGIFTGVLIWSLRKKKSYLNHMSDLPLDGGEKNPTDHLQS